MKHLGDITNIDGSKIEPVDVITGGSPCQDLSVAGLRAGLDGERSGLFMEQIRIVKEMRANEISNGRSGRNVRPRYMVWENVCGAFSSNGGKDFQTVLTEIARIVEPEAPDVPLPERGGWSKSGCIYSPMGKWSIAWRLHDAQFWGVPQRRKRIALVADFGGLSAPEILFERKGVSGYTEPGEKQKQGTSDEIRSGSASADRERERERERERRSCGIDVYNQEITGDVSATVTSATGGTNTSGGKVMQEQEAFGMSPYHSNCMLSDNPHSGIYKADTSRTLDLNGGNPNCNQGGIMVVTPTADNAGGEIGRNDTRRTSLSDDDLRDLQAERHNAGCYDRCGNEGGAFRNNADPVRGDSKADGQSERSVHDSYGFSCSASATAQTIGFQREIAASLRGNNTHDGTVLIEKKNEREKGI